MKILVVSPALPSPAVEMRGLRTHEPLTILRARGHDVRAVVPVLRAPPWLGQREAWRDRRRVPAEEVDHGVTIAHPRHCGSLHLLRLPFGVRMARSLFWRAIRDEIDSFVRSGGDIVHLHSSLLPGVVVGRTGDARVVVSMHDDELFDVAPASVTAAAAIGDTLRGADAVVYVSETLRRRGTRLAGAHSASVVPMAVDRHPDIARVHDGPFTVITAARLIQRKNIDLLIRAFADFHRAAPQTRLVVAGDGPERGRLEAMAQSHGLSGSVEFLGHVPNRRIFELFARAHLFVLPSVRESLGMVYFEAMSMGVPVVGVQGEGIAEYVSHGVDGFLISPGARDELSHVMKTMYRDQDQRGAIAERAHGLVARSGLDWADWVEAYIDVFSRLLGRSH